jgi:hypothetical protein
MDHTAPHSSTQLHHKPHPKPFHSQFHTLYSREDPRPLVTASSTIMIVVHFTKLSTMYPYKVISSLGERLETLLFIIPYISFGLWPRDHYMPLQRFTMGHMLGLVKIVCSNIVMQRFSEVVRGTTNPLAPCGLGRMTMTLPTHPSKAHIPQHL